MFRNYLKSALRNVLKRKAFAFINITGLAVGITCCLLISLFVWEEWNYDTFHADVDSIYRVAATFETTQGSNDLALSPSPLAVIVPETIAEVERATRFQTTEVVVAIDNERFLEEEVVFADTAFFQVLSFPLTQGNAEAALEAPFSVVLAPALAEKYFGTANPMGQTLQVEGQHTFTVTGILEPLPSNSHIQFDMILSMASWEPMGRVALTGWFDEWMYTYVRLTPEADVSRFEEQLIALIDERVNEPIKAAGIHVGLALEPIRDIYLHSKRLGQVGNRLGSENTLYVFTLIAIFILGIACINFMNLSTARSAERAKEVGVRKVVGAQEHGLVAQFLLESIVLAMIAGSLAMILAEVLLPSFEVLAGRSLTAHVLTNAPVVALLVGTTIVVGVLAGVYPAFVLARFQPVRVLKGAFRNSKQGRRLRQGLVILQFGLTVALIAGTLIVFSQLEYMREFDLGFSQDQQIIVNLGAEGLSQERTEMLVQRLEQHAAVRGVTASDQVPFSGYSIGVLQVERQDGIEQQTSLNYISVDEDFLEQYEINMVAGRAFSEERGDTRWGAVLINEAAVAYLGFTSPVEAVGRSVDYNNESTGQIIGVVSDFNYVTLHQQIEPLGLHFKADPYGYITASVATGSMRQTLGELENIWREVLPDRVFDYQFMDTVFGEMYEADQRFGRVFGIFATLAIFIACLGLFGLATFTIQQRSKEIGVRKVLGASVSGIVVLLSKEFTRLVLVALVLAIPVAYIGLDQWLGTFAYRIDIGWLSFVLAGVLAVGIALATISYQAIRAATANPIDALRYE